MKTHKKYGFTLIEIIVTLFILTVLTSIIVPSVSIYVERSRESVDVANVRTLNHASALYRLVEGVSAPDTFFDLSTDIQRQERLADLGYIGAPIEPASSLNTIEWDVSKQLWVYSKFAASTIGRSTYLFNSSFDINQLLRGRDSNSANNNWSLTADGLRGSQGSMFIENANASYSIETTVRMATIATAGGIGIYVETSLSDDGGLFRDTGYIVQLDRGYANGEVVVRRRTNSTEGNPIARSTIGVENRNDNPNWWVEDRVVRIEIRQDPNNASKKLMDVYVDGVKSIDSFRIDANIDPNQNFTGVRGWNQPAIMSELTIQEQP